MTDHEHRDPELESIRSHWKVPERSPELFASVLQAYRVQMSRKHRKRRRIWILLPATATMALVGLLSMWKSQERTGFQPVEHPRLIVISRGEKP